MKSKDFKKMMAKAVFRTEEAKVLAFDDDSNLINLQLHQWKQAGDLVRLKRGVYMFKGSNPDKAEIAKCLYEPCYFSLEYALNFYGIMTESVFDYTLVTPKITRLFKTPVGTFSYRKIKREAFTGYDAKTLMALPEKALVDYFYLNRANLKSDNDFWRELRLNLNACPFSFSKATSFAGLFKNAKLLLLLNNFQSYAKSCQADK